MDEPASALDPEDRGHHGPAQTGLHGGHSDSQHATGGPHLGLHRLLLHREHGRSGPALGVRRDGEDVLEPRPQGDGGLRDGTVWLGMPRETFQQELDGLISDLLDLGAEVEASLENMVRAMESRDAEAARRELGVDVRYKTRGMEIEKECIILQARQAPVAKDLRLLYTVQSVTNHLVRSGTLSEHICHAIADTAGCERDEDLDATLVEMASTARNVFDEGLDVFKDRDIERA